MVFADKKMYLQPFSIIFKYVYERTFAYKIIIGNRLQARKRFRTALKLTQASSVKTCQRPGLCRRKSYWIKKQSYREITPKALINGGWPVKQHGLPALAGINYLQCICRFDNDELQNQEEAKEERICLGESQLRGRMGKLL